MYCRYCGKELPNDSKFCVYCGQGVSGPEIFGQNARGRDEARNREVFEEKQGAGNDYRPYPISGENMVVPERGRKKSLLPIVILVTVIVLVGVVAAFVFHIKNRDGNQQNKNGNTQAESSKTDESNIKDKDAKDSTVASDKLTAAVTGSVPNELAGKAELYFATAIASSELVQENTSIYNGAVCAVDGDAVTSWQEGAPGNGVGETLTIGFLEPQRVDYLEFNAGNWRDENQWNRNLKPKGLEITANGEKFNVELQNVRASQYVVFSEPVETATFVIKITDVYPGAEGESDVPISEVKAFGETLGKNEKTISDTQPKESNGSADGNTSANAGPGTSGDTDNANAGSGGNTPAGTGSRELTYNSSGHPNWYEAKPYWKHSYGGYVCKVYGASGDDLTFEFSDGVQLSGKYCYYEVQSDGSVLYSYKKGWSVIYYPDSDTLFSGCDPSLTQSRNMGYYYPVDREVYEKAVSGGGADADFDPYGGKTEDMWMRSQTTVRSILDHLDVYGTHSFISDSGKSAITFDEDKEGSDSTDMFYTNISGVTPDDVWVLMDGDIAGNTATLHVRNAQGQKAKVVADFGNGTIDFAGVIYRNTATKYY